MERDNKAYSEKVIAGLTEACSNGEDIRVDLHTHSAVSDGRYSPADLVALAAEKKVKLLALTDHDTYNGISEAAEAAARQQIHLAAGTEISSIWRGREIHVVGLSFDLKSEEMAGLISRQSELRDERARAIGARLEKCGITDAYARTRAMIGEDAAMTRGSYASFLCSIGVAETEGKCFAAYLAENKKAYVKPQWTPIEEVTECILKAGGIPVLAHPRCYDLNNKWLRMLITDFKNAGGEAMETAGNVQSPADRAFLADLSVEYGLYASCGSDFHKECVHTSIGNCRFLGLAQKTRPVWSHEKFRLEI